MRIGEIVCLRSDDQESPTGTGPGWQVSRILYAYILYKYPRAHFGLRPAAFSSVADYLRAGMCRLTVTL